MQCKLMAYLGFIALCGFHIYCAGEHWVQATGAAAASCAAMTVLRRD